MSKPRLSETSYIVLGMLELVPSATPYDLKQFAKHSTMNFWTVPHAQVYKECTRLAEDGLLSEEREEGGRRRKFYRLTQRGREALEAWRKEPTAEHAQIREPALLKLFLGVDPVKLATSELKVNEERVKRWEVLHEVGADVAPRGPRLALEAGIGHARESVRFWKSLVDSDAEAKAKPKATSKSKPQAKGRQES
jgi:DNA-binding PadR family transcriptional regulator